MKNVAKNKIWTSLAGRVIGAIAGIAFVSLAASGAHAQATATASTGASVTIADPIAISKTADLAFGTVVASAAAGTVTVGTTNNRTVGGGVSALGGTVTSAAYTVTGYGTSSYSIALPTSVSLTGPGTAMTANTFVSSVGGSASLTAGTGSFAVGATLAVGANQAAGAYSGTFDVTVAYN